MFSKGSNRIFVAGYDGQRLRGAIVREDAGQVRVEQVAEIASGSDPVESLPTLLLEMSGADFPTEAIVVSTQAIPLLMELPASPDRPPPPMEMESMVRWELDGHLGGRIPGSVDDMVCGWSPQSGFGQSAETSVFPWLVGAMLRSVRDSWKAALSIQGFELNGIYPQQGAAAGLLPGGTMAAIFEVYPGKSTCTVAGPNGVALIRSMDDKSGSDSLLRSLSPMGIRQVWHCGSLAVDERIVDLASRLGAELRELGPAIEGIAAGNISPGTVADIAGAAANALGVSGGASVVQILSSDRVPPVTERAGFWWAIAAGVLLLGIGSFESYQYRTLKSVNAEVSRAKDSSEKYRHEMEEMKRNGDLALREKAKVASTRKSLRNAERKLEVLGDGISRRHEYVIDIFEQLGNAAAASDGRTIVDKVVETDRRDLEISAFALDNLDASRFVRSFLASMKRWGMTQENPTIRAEKGRLGVAGVRVDLTLIPLEDAMSTAPSVPGLPSGRKLP